MALKTETQIMAISKISGIKEYVQNLLCYDPIYIVFGRCWKLKLTAAAWIKIK